MALLLIFAAALVFLGYTAQRWGYDSRDGFREPIPTGFVERPDQHPVGR